MGMRLALGSREMAVPQTAVLAEPLNTEPPAVLVRAGVDPAAKPSSRQPAPPWPQSDGLKGGHRDGDQLVPVAAFEKHRRPPAADPLHEASVAVVNRAGIAHHHRGARQDRRRRLGCHGGPGMGDGLEPLSEPAAPAAGSIDPTHCAESGWPPLRPDAPQHPPPDGKPPLHGDLVCLHRGDDPESQRRLGRLGAESRIRSPTVASV
jgi:hypothetical protein